VGMGEAALSPAAHSYLSDAYPSARLARAMAVYTLGITIGGGMALMIGGTVIEAVATSGDVTLPLLGTYRSWQAAFLLVATPGILVAVLVLAIKEPLRGKTSRPGAMRKAPGLLFLCAYLVRNRRAFIPIYFSSALLGIMGYGMTAWYPTLLIRDFALTQGEAGRYLGAIFLVLGSAGSISGGYLAERFALRGRSDANLLTVAIVAAATSVPATCAPLMSSAWLVLLCFAPACFIFNAYFACSVAAIQLATPRDMRATNAALFLLVNSLIGLSIGTAVVPLLDRHLFGASGHIGPSLAIVALVACLTAAALAVCGLSAYGKLVSDVEAG
jgi:MFS family permease